MTTDPIEVIQQFAHGMKIVGYDVSKVYAALETVQKQQKNLVYLLSELHVIVKGECPRLLDDDSGGSGELDCNILAAVKQIGDV